ncbi:unnamed protein product [Diatraea saccharalis]|uniref:RING finger protein 17 n=1 Tax=Diatraea saccharalis TaxID=40085 RepID=A0A9P0C4L7_9NEOP|nr:unnamed protein product [Diatraea saccharalis]
MATMAAKTKKCCPNCSQFYQLKPSHPRGNIPLLLTCGHSMCENCIKNIVRFVEPIECKICHRDMEVKPSNLTLLSQNKIKLYDIFPVNVFMLGELTLQSMEESNEQTRKCAETDDFYVDLQSIIKSTENTQGECLECHKLTTKMCQQCATILCDTCFNKSHKNFVIFRNHLLTNIEPAMEPNVCKIHKDRPLDYYCKDCSKSLCMDCMMVGEKSCKNHNVVSIQEINNDFLEELSQLSPKVDETFKRLTKTAVDIGNLLHNIENDTGSASELTNMINDIEQHFSKLSSQIQKHKQEVIGIIVKLKSAEKDSLHKAKNDIENSIKVSHKMLNIIKSTSDANKSKQLNLATLLESAKQILETPWYLSRDEKNTASPLKVKVNEDLCALVTDYIHLEGNVKSVYRLQSTSDLGQDFELPPPPVAPVFPPDLPKDVRQQSKNKNIKKDNSKSGFYKAVPKYHTKSGSVSSLNSLDSDSSKNSFKQGDKFHGVVVQPVSPFAESQHPKQLHEGSQEIIYISHIVDPHNFFVQRACHQKLVKDMLREFRNATSLPKPSISHVAEGKVYLMFNKADNMWQRCRVVSIDRSNIDKPLYHVFCIDFGSTEVVNIDKLRLLPPARLQSPFPLAINCSLANCVPKTGVWTSDDAILIQNIIDNKQAVIHIRRIQSTSDYTVKLECDVTTFEDGVSIAHALVFHDRAKMPNPKLPYPKLLGIVERPKLFFSNNDYKPKSIEEVYITHIVSPDKFFVRKCHLQNLYEKMCEELEQEYSLSVNTGTIYLPEINMVCVVNTEKYHVEGVAGTWARAIITELPGRARVRLLLPDTGATLLAHCSALRHIQPRFTTQRALATECYLAGVTPQNKKWSPGSVALLQKFEDRLLELHVEDCRNRGGLGVTLYDKADPDNEICINKEMIKYKFAVTFGLFRFNKNDIEEQVITNKTPLDKINNQEKKDHIKILKNEHTTKKKIKEEDLEAKDKGPLRLEVKVLQYQSPSLLYVAVIHQQKVFNELYEKIQKFYTTRKAQGKNDWNIGDRCCCLCNQSQTWRRAVIIEFEKENAKVFYSDFACIETVPIANLKELAPEFLSIGDAAIKCHLYGVIPAVGEEWPSLTKEYLKELLDAYKRVFITKHGNFKNKSMPVEIWVYHTIQGGALEPNKSEWRCLNDKIIEQGLGIPDKTNEMNTPTEPVSTDSEMLSFLNITGSVREWLQLEPLPVNPLISKSTKSDSESNTPSPDYYEESSGKIEDILPLSNTVFISDWLPPEPLQSKEFTGMPTYIDNDGIIYLHDVSQQDTLDLIRKALDVRFKDPDPKAKYAKWTVGEPCIAMFFLDNRFYRGRILEVNEETSTCLIHYVDYGNEETCTFTNLRKSIALYQIPIQAHKCILDRIRPIGAQWDRQTLDYIHKSVVEKQCFIKITGEKVDGVLPIEMKYDKLWINDHLVDFEMACYTDGSKPIVRKYAPPPAPEDLQDNNVAESDSGPDYIIEDDTETIENSISQDSFQLEAMIGKDWNEIVDEDNNKQSEDRYMAYPKVTKKEFLCKITVINDTETLELNVIHDDETNLLYEEMFGNLQKEAELMHPMDGIFENKACIALFPEDNQWYRASILQYSESKNQVKVRYVDYGNIETISLADVREIPDEYVKLPPASLQVRLHGVKINPDIDVNLLCQEYNETFLQNNDIFYAKIIDYDDLIPIVTITYENNDLVYKNLIEKGIFIETNKI